jgi:hypothetical protein
VLQFNADTGTDDDIIQLEAGTYALTIQNVSGRHETAGFTGDLNLNQTSHRWIIQGAGSSGDNATIIDASQLQDRVFQIVNPGTQVLFQDLVIQGGLAQDNGADGALAGTTDSLGGGVLNNGGDLTLDNVVLQNNVAQGGGDASLRTVPGHNAFGGGIYSTGGALTLAGATIANNQAHGGRGGDHDGRYPAGAGGSAGGGGLYATGGSVDISASMLASNRATGGGGGDGVVTCFGSYCTRSGNGGSGGEGLGGGLYVNGSALTISTSTIATNQGTGGSGGAYGYGGSGLGAGLYNGGTLTVSNSTLSGNSATGPGGGIDSFGTLTVSNSTLSGNSASNGGAIWNAGTLTVSDSTLSGNTAGQNGAGIETGGALTVMGSTLSGNSAGYSGGGIYNYGTVTVSHSTLSGNSATGTYVGGGGINNYGTLTVSNSTLSGNSASYYGGGIFNNFFGTLTVSNSTLSGNSAPYGYGGGIDTYSSYRVTLTNVTLTANRAGIGGGLDVLPGSFVFPVLHNTLIAGNFLGATGATPDDVYGSLDPGSDSNLIGDGTGMTGLHNGVNGNQVGSASAPIDPLLGPLADNGGPTLTHALLSGSPAIDAGNNAYATDWGQRGPGYPRIVNGIIDIGAFEVQAPAASRPTRQPLPDPMPLQALGMAGGPLLGQPPTLTADPIPLPGTGTPDGQSGQPGTDPVSVPTTGGQLAPESFTVGAGNGQPADTLGPAGGVPVELPTLELSG